MLRLRKFMFDEVYLGAGGAQRARPGAPDAERALRPLPRTARRREGEELQRVTDYIAGMTDRFAIATFRRVALPEESQAVMSFVHAPGVGRARRRRRRTSSR